MYFLISVLFVIPIMAGYPCFAPYPDYDNEYACQSYNEFRGIDGTYIVYEVTIIGADTKVRCEGLAFGKNGSSRVFLDFYDLGIFGEGDLGILYWGYNEFGLRPTIRCKGVKTNTSIEWTFKALSGFPEHVNLIECCNGICYDPISHYCCYRTYDRPYKICTRNETCTYNSDYDNECCPNIRVATTCGTTCTRETSHCCEKIQHEEPSITGKYCKSNNIAECYQ